MAPASSTVSSSRTASERLGRSSSRRGASTPGGLRVLRLGRPDLSRPRRGRDLSVEGSAAGAAKDVVAAERAEIRRRREEIERRLAEIDRREAEKVHAADPLLARARAEAEVAAKVRREPSDDDASGMRIGFGGGLPTKRQAERLRGR